jgi:3-oxoacyl-[acyl-carrier protein] reductase
MENGTTGSGQAGKRKASTGKAATGKASTRTTQKTREETSKARPRSAASKPAKLAPTAGVKHYLVTGAASGIGRELVVRLLSEGHRVWACDLNTQAMADLASHAIEQTQLHVQSLDVRDAKAWAATAQNMADAWERIDVLCNVAGVLKENWCDAASAAEVDFHFDVNVKGVIFGVQAVLPHMKRQKSGHIVNIASIAGLLPVPGLSLYSASKFAVRAYSLAAAIELQPHGISMTAVCPDAVQTPMLDIQLGKEETALTFSGPRALTTREVVDAIIESEKTRALEVMLPMSRGVTAKAANLLPGVTAKVIGLFKSAGLKRQRKIVAGQASTLA